MELNFKVLRYGKQVQREDALFFAKYQSAKIGMEIMSIKLPVPSNDEECQFLNDAADTIVRAMNRDPLFQELEDALTKVLSTNWTSSSGDEFKIGWTNDPTKRGEGYVRDALALLERLRLLKEADCESTEPVGSPG